MKARAGGGRGAGGWRSSERSQEIDVLYSEVSVFVLVGVFLAHLVSATTRPSRPHKVESV